MMKLDGVLVFVAVADGGSISEAARRLGLSKSVVSDRLVELEGALGARLVQRTTRRMSLTEDGTAFLVRARRIVHDMTEAASEIAERRGALVGPLRIAGPASFGSLHLGPALNSFLAQHPGIDLSLDLEDRFVDVAADGYDAVVRHGSVADSRLVAKRLARSRRLLVASPGFLAVQGMPTSVAELEIYPAVLYANRESDWRFAGPSGWQTVRPRARLRVNNGLVMRDAALAGLGLTLLPSFLVYREIAAGDLMAIDVGIEPEGAEVHIAYRADRGASAKVRALTDWLRRSFGDPPYWDTAGAAANA